MTEDEYVICERCGNEQLPERMQDISLSEEWNICDGCVMALEEDVEYHDWKDRYTEKQHERAVSVLSEYDEVYCTISDYAQGAIVIHTPYVSADLVVDVCRHFGLRITDFQPSWHQESEWPCVGDHGDAFEITLKYLPESPVPSHIDAVFTDNRIDDLDDSDKQFD